jgi:hypothetical protein
MMKIQKSCHAGIDNKYYVATSAATATIRTSKGHKFFTMYGNAAIATFSCGGMESYAVYKCSHGAPSLEKRKRAR